MLFEKKSYNTPDIGGDFDTAPNALAPNAWINSENVRVLTTDGGQIGNLESIGSTELLPNPYLPAGDNIEIGHAEDEAGSRFVCCMWNSNGDHAIFAYYFDLKSWFIVLLNSQVTGGLNFDKNQVIHSTQIINFCFYWVNNMQNIPRRINIEAGIKMNHPGFVTNFGPYTNPLTQSVISWARRQPGGPPSQTKIYQTSPALATNFVATEALLFSYRYIYRDYEISTLSGFSTLANFNAAAELYNRIDIAIPLSEKIDQDVIQIDVVALFMQTQTAFIIKSWRTAIPADLAAIQAHNSMSSPIPLTFSFYNDIAGVTLDAAYVAKIFDSIPINAKTYEPAKNRSFLANYTIGYNSPIQSSLAVSLVSVSFTPGGTTTLIGQWYMIRYVDFIGHAYTDYVLQTNFQVNSTDPIHPFFYYIYTPSTVPPYPPTVNAGDLTWIGYDSNSVGTGLYAYHHYTSTFLAVVSFSYTGNNSVVNPGGIPVTNYLGRAFKTFASYYVSISFKDNYGAECGIYTNPSLVVYIPDSHTTTIGTYNFTNAINWTLNNTSAVSEIPDWAYYFSINITKCLRTRFFVQGIGTFIYASKDSSNNWVFTTTTFSANLAGVAIDITLLNSYGQGYIFSQGDQARVYVNNNYYNLSIIDQSAQYVICQLVNVGSLASVEGQYELYTPYKQQTNEPYFEIGQIYPILNPGTTSKSYSIISGTIGGDIHLLQRTNGTLNYITESMSPNDKYYKDWFTQAGRPNFVDTIGQVYKQDSISFSNTFIPGSQVNGLSTFDALDVSDVYPECGPISKLTLTSKVEGQPGTVMLAICEDETASLYLSETQMLSSDKNQFLAQATGVIGTINVLKGSFGTFMPESVFEFRGNVFWWDGKNGKIIQYSSNGLFPISNYKATRFWKLFSEQFLLMTPSEIEAFGSRPFVFISVDPHNWELLVTIPKLLTTPPKGYLPDYPNMIYPFDIWDGQAKTMVYKLSAEPNFWQGAFLHTPEGMVSMRNTVFGFKNGSCYKHNSISNYTISIYGQSFLARIMQVGSQDNRRPKVYNNISLEGNYRPSFVYFRVEPSFVEFEEFDLAEQATDLLDFDFEMKEGELYSYLYRNKLQPTATGLNFDGLLVGNKIRAITLFVLIEFAPTRAPLELRHFTLGYQISGGHST